MIYIVLKARDGKESRLPWDESETMVRAFSRQLLKETEAKRVEVRNDKDEIIFEHGATSTLE